MNTDSFTMRLSPSDRRRLADLAGEVNRSESDVVRLLIRVATPVAFGGITIPQPVTTAPTTQPTEAYSVA